MLCRSRNKKCTFFDPPVTKRKTLASKRSASSCRAELSANREQPSDSHEETTTLYYIGTSGDQNPDLYRHLPFNSNQCFVQEEFDWACKRFDQDACNPVHFTILSNKHLDTGCDPSLDLYDHSKLEELVAPHGALLKRIFISIVHPSYPILDEGIIKTPSCRYRTSLLAAIYSLGIKHWDFLPESDAAGQAPVFAPVIHYLEMAIWEETKNPNLETVQAVLLYLQIPPTLVRAPNDPGHWIMTSALVAMAHDLGLHLDSISWELSDQQRQLRNRLRWAIYMQNVWLALGLGRPLLINEDDDWDMSEIKEKDLTNANVGPCTKYVFLKMASLTCIVAKILRNYFTLKAWRKPEFSKLEELSYEIKSWRSQVSFSSVSRNTQCDPTGTLELSYYITQVLYSRAKMRYYSELQVGEPSILEDGPMQIVSSIITFAKNLTACRARSFWWGDSRLNFAVAGSFIISLLLASSNDTEFQERKASAEYYRHCLRIQSQLFITPQLAAVRMDLIIGRFKKSSIVSVTSDALETSA